jgi:predicted porin
MNFTNKSAMAFGTLLFVSSGAVYSAEPEVSFYGLLDVYLGSVKAEGADNRALVVNPSGMTTSFIGAKTKIDLGNGLSGVASVESFLRPDTGEAGRFDGDQFYARDAFIGVEGGFGSVTFGRNTTPYFISVITTNPFGGSFGFGPSIKHSFLGGLQGDSGWGNSVLYSSPSVSGFKGTVLYSAGEKAGETGLNKFGASAFYSMGKLAGTLAYQSVDTQIDDAGAAKDDKQSATLLGVDYDFGAVKAYGQYQKMKTTAAAGNEDYKTYQLGATVPLGKSSILVSYAHTSLKAAADSTYKTFAAGYDVTVDKKMDLYAVIYRDDHSDVDGTGNGLALGGRVQF